MRQGLIAQWHRGILARGLVGAMLLMIPVLVGATIGLGGVAGGLTSLASGPSATAVGPITPKSTGDDSSQNLEKLSASLTTTLAQRVTVDRSGNPTGSAKSGGGAPLVTSVGGGGTSDSSSSSSGGGNAPASTGSGAGSTSTPPITQTPSVPSTSGATNIVTDLLNNLLNPNGN